MVVLCLKIVLFFLFDVCVPVTFAELETIVTLRLGDPFFQSNVRDSVIVMKLCFWYLWEALRQL